MPKPDETINIIAYKTPKQIILQIVKIGIAKSQLPHWQTLLLGFMAGCYIALGGLLAVQVAGGLTSPAKDLLPAGIGVTNPGLVKLVLGAVFPFGLMLVVVAGAELFTGNTMYMIPALIEKRVTWKHVAMNWSLSYLSNFIGSVAVAYFLGYLTNLTSSEPVHTYVQTIAYSKANTGWGANFLRGIGCNWLVCMALFTGLAAQDLGGKLMGLWWPIFAFVAMGFEHSVANMFYVPLGLMEGAGTTFGAFLAYNLIPVTLGNIIGGSLFVAVAEWAAYQSYFGDAAATVAPVPGNKRHHRNRHRHSARNNAKNHNNANKQAAPEAEMAAGRPALAVSPPPDIDIDELGVNAGNAEVRIPVSSPDSTAPSTPPTSAVASQS